MSCLIDPDKYYNFYCSKCKSFRKREEATGKGMIILVAKCYEQENGDIIQIPDRASCDKCYTELQIRQKKFKVGKEQKANDN